MRTRVVSISVGVLTVLSAGLLTAFAPAAETRQAETRQAETRQGEWTVAAVSTQGDTVPGYVEEQADSGAAVFKRVCQECHEKVDVAGADFRAKWSGQSVFALFERIRTSMPDSNPGSLPREDYANVMAYLLRLNGIPSNTNRLVADSTALSEAKLVLPPLPGQ